MPETLKTAYNILYRLEHDDGTRYYKGTLLSPAALDVDDNTWRNVMRDLQKNGYIDGYEEKKDITGELYCKFENVYITIKGAQYLQENSAFKKLEKKVANHIKIELP